MNDYTDYFVWLDEGEFIRTSARAIIFNRAKNRILIERISGIHREFSNFLGGGLDVGETLQACIERELNEETNAKVKRAEYLFVVENFIPHKSKIRHSLEHYFEIDLDCDNVAPRNMGVEYTWILIDELETVDLRPIVVRNSIIDGTYRQVNQMITGNGAV